MLKIIYRSNYINNMYLLCDFMGDSLSFIMYNIRSENNVINHYFELIDFLIKNINTFLNNQAYIFDDNEVKHIKVRRWTSKFSNKKFINFNRISFMLEFIDFVLQETRMLLLNNKFEQADDLIDVIHYLPELIYTGKKLYKKNYWNTMIIPYMKKWKVNYFDKFRYEFTQTRG